ncbi:methylated-DNA--[protein]-cysteine S-methyltransferase [Cellulomonas massiliensis]|uniref:methylated-DNA--[protein]-cysteine S-methyltransferase n=1 Tax=Cellulomonas massiliensis TaxID=1465811 RepID=UPI0002F56977|nr:methylated-DNA--[protein]-cysteine S-methyltransferase [Cellulomonas massiliensis]
MTDQDLLAGARVPDETLVRLRGRLADAAAAEDLLDVAYRTLDSPVGTLLVAATPAGVVRVAFEVQGHDAALEELAAAVSPRVLEAPHRLDVVARELEEYFTGRRRAFDVALDLRLARGFRREVVEHLSLVPYGTTATYAWVASLAGRPAAVRAVGTACARNPLPLVLPCHRVVRSDGTAGRYAGGDAAKHLLLRLEQEQA